MCVHICVDVIHDGCRGGGAKRAEGASVVVRWPSGVSANGATRDGSSRGRAEVVDVRDGGRPGGSFAHGRSRRHDGELGGLNARESAVSVKGWVPVSNDRKVML